MSRILCWNVRGLGNTITKRVLKDLLIDNKIDLVGLQETKMETFPSRFFQTLSVKISFWTFKPSCGNLGGILVGVNEDKYEVLTTWVKEFSVSLLLKNKFDSFE